jgi:hypothetical protein
MKTSFNGRKCLALLLGPISVLVLAGSINSSFASAEPYAPQNTMPVAEYETGAEVPVPPWCAWHSSIPENVLLAPVDDPSGVITYRGAAVDLGFSSDWNYTYVSGEVGRTTKDRSSNCSWFGDPAYGSQLDVEISSNDFNAYIINGVSWTRDPAMDFTLSNANNFTLTRNLDATCDDFGNSFVTNALSTQLARQPAHAPSNLTVVSGASTLTNNFCKWTAEYTVQIPAGLEPTYNRAFYAWIGPQLIYTLSFPVE